MQAPTKAHVLYPPYACQIFTRRRLPEIQSFYDLHRIRVAAKPRSSVGSSSPLSGTEHVRVLVGVERPTRQSVPYVNLDKKQKEQLFQLACNRWAQGREDGVGMLEAGLAVAKELRVTVGSAR